MLYKTFTEQNNGANMLGQILKFYKAPVILFALFSLFLLTITLYPKNSILFFMDTYNVYEGFHYNYQEFFFNGRLPEWDTYLHYGQPTYVYDLIYYTPFHYLAILMGKALHLTNSYYLFLIVFCVQMFIYIFGLYVLLRLFISNNTAIFIAIGISALTNMPISNMYTNFLGAYLMPLSLYFLIEAFRKGRLYYFLLMVFIGLVFGFGITTYWIGIYLFIYTLILILLLALLLAKEPEKRRFSYWRKFFSFNSRTAIIVFIIFLFAAGLGYLLISSREYLSFSLSSGRDPVTLKNTIATFLSYPESEGLRNAAEALLGGASVHPDWSNFYMTGVGLFFIVYSLFMFRPLCANIYYVLVVVMFFITLFLCWGPYTPVARIAYYFPMVAYFRHIAGLYTFPKMFGSLLIGFGIHVYMIMHSSGDQKMQHWSRTAALLSGMVCMAASIIAAIWYFYGGGSIGQFQKVIESAKILITFNIVSLAILSASVAFQRKKAVIIIAVAFLLTQSVLYYWHYRYNYYRAADIDRSKYSTIHESGFEETRVVLPNHSNTSAWDAVKFQHAAGLSSHGWLNIDLCAPFDRVDYSTTGVFKLRTIEGTDLQRIIGCGTSKIQIVEGYEERLLGNSKAELKDAIGKGIALEDGKGKVILLSKKGKEYPDALTLASQGIKIKGFSSNKIDLEVSASGDDGAWLVYADAYHPHWRAWIDSRPADIWIASLAFKAVKIPNGEHTVSFEFGKFYRRVIYWLCVISGGLGVLAALFWALFSELKKSYGLKALISFKNAEMTK